MRRTFSKTIALLLGSLILGAAPSERPALGQAPALTQTPTENDRRGFDTTKLAPERAFTREAVARWNDRSTPRRTLETFFFAITSYDLAPPLIVNAIDCMDMSLLAGEVSEANAALMAHELNSILTRQDIALYGVPDQADAEGGSLKLVERGRVQISLRRGEDGRWRFDAPTIKRIPEMRSEATQSQRQLDEARLKLLEGRTDPETTMRSFFMDLTRRDFLDAARCLDLREVPPKLRAGLGPELARKLAFVMQRCRFAFPQEIPGDPDGWRHVWHSNHRGRIMLDRVRQPDGRDAWLFSRMTLRNLDAMVQGFMQTPPDPRYAFLGVVIVADDLAGAKKRSSPAPSHVPISNASPRATLRTFLEGIDDLESDDPCTRLVLGCLDLGEIPEAERNSLGLRRAGKLEAVLQKLNIDLLGVPDQWESEPQSFGDEIWRVTIARQPDGAWQFDRETVARIPEMYDRLNAAEKTRKGRASRFASARQTLRTFTRATSRGDNAQAAAALDLGEIPISARAEIGPVLTTKLRYIIDHIGRFNLQEIPDEADGPRYIFYRGPLGRIGLEPTATGPRQGDWLFTTETVARIEPMFLELLHSGHGSGATTESAAAVPYETLQPAPASLPLLIRRGLPRWLNTSLAGLAAYQWAGLALLPFLAGMASWLTLALIDLVLRLTICRTNVAVGHEFICGRLRPVAWQAALLLSVVLLPLLDLPIALVGGLLPVTKLVWVGLIGWTAVRLVDLAMAFYANSEHLLTRRNLSDMIVPTGARVLKLGVILVAFAVQVYLVGNGEWVTRLFAGLGLVGLAASLAAQDTLKSFFGTLLLIGEHPFRIGDSIVVNGMEGTVESVGFRSTWLRTPEDSLITIPNSIIAGASIDNRGARNYRRFRTLVGISQNTPIDRLVALRDAIQLHAQSSPAVHPDKIEVHIHSLASNGIELLVNVYFMVNDFTAELKARDRMIRGILDHARELDVELSTTSSNLQLAIHDEERPGIPAPMFSKVQRKGDSQSQSPRDLARNSAVPK